MALNLVLGAWLMRNLRGSPSILEAPTDASASDAPKTSILARGSASLQSAPKVPGSPWSELETTNLTEFAANLRRVGCPEETICDLLRPAAYRWFTSRIQAADRERDFWASGMERQKQDRENTSGRSALRQEERQFLSSLPCNPDAETYSGMEWMIDAAVLGSMNSPQHEELLALLSQMEARISYWSERSKGMFLPEEVDAIHQEHTEFITKLGSLLSESQKEEFLLRSYALFNWMDRLPPKLADLHLNGPQLREFCRILVAQDSNLNSLWSGYLNLLNEGPPPAPWPQTVRDMTALLGDERSIEGFEIIDKDLDLSINQAAQASNRTLTHQIIDRVIAWKSEVYKFRERWNKNPDGVEAALPVAAQEVRRQLTGLLANTAIPLAEQHTRIDDWIREFGGTAWKRK